MILPHDVPSFWKSAAFPAVPKAGGLLERLEMCYGKFHEQYSAMKD